MNPTVIDRFLMSVNAPTTPKLRTRFHHGRFLGEHTTGRTILPLRPLCKSKSIPRFNRYRAVDMINEKRQSVILDAIDSDSRLYGHITEVAVTQKALSGVRCTCMCTRLSDTIAVAQPGATHSEPYSLPSPSPLQSDGGSLLILS